MFLTHQIELLNELLLPLGTLLIYENFIFSLGQLVIFPSI